MPFVINPELCAACGSCIGNCPNRAIIRRSENEVVITDMCCDCGVCVRYCPVQAIGKGPERAVLDTETLDRALKDKLDLTKNIAAMKFCDTIPEDVPLEKGPHFWCGMCGDVFDGDAHALVFTADASTCGGCANVGLGGKRVGRDEFIAAIESNTVGPGRLMATKTAMTKSRDLFPRFPVISKGMIIGPLPEVKRPDLVMFPVTAQQLCVISTAFCYESGDVITGFAGKSTCLMSISTPLVENRPVFCAGDHGGRMFMRLDPSELLVCFPFRLIPGLVKNLDKTYFAKEPAGG